MGEMLAQTERAKGSKCQLKGEIPKGAKLVGSNRKRHGRRADSPNH